MPGGAGMYCINCRYPFQAAGWRSMWWCGAPFGAAPVYAPFSQEMVLDYIW